MSILLWLLLICFSEKSFADDQDNGPNNLHAVTNANKIIPDAITVTPLSCHAPAVETPYAGVDCQGNISRGKSLGLQRQADEMLVKYYCLVEKCAVREKLSLKLPGFTKKCEDAISAYYRDENNLRIRLIKEIHSWYPNPKELPRIDDKLKKQVFAYATKATLAAAEAALEAKGLPNGLVSLSFEAAIQILLTFGKESAAMTVDGVGAVVQKALARMFVPAMIVESASNSELACDTQHLNTADVKIVNSKCQTIHGYSSKFVDFITYLDPSVPSDRGGQIQMLNGECKIFQENYLWGRDLVFNVNAYDDSN